MMHGIALLMVYGKHGKITPIYAIAYVIILIKKAISMSF